MKRLLLVVVCISLMFTISACRKAESEKEKTGAVGLEFNTVADAYAVDAREQLDSLEKEHYVYIFKDNGALIRVIADLPKDVLDKVDSLDMDDEDYDNKKRELLKPLKVIKVEDLSNRLLSDQQLSDLKGKTGKDLLNEGFKVFAYYGDEGGSQVVMDKLVAQYIVTFEDPDHKIGDDVENKDIKKLEIVNAQYYGLSYSGTDID